MTTLLFFGIIVVVGAAVTWWLLFITEGVYLGQRVVIWLYNVYADRYDTIKNFDPKSEILFLGLSTLGVLKGVRAPLVLDVATGTGRFPIVLANEPYFNGRVWGVDLSRKMLAQAAQKLPPQGDRVRWLWYAAEHLPFEDETFDMVSCLEALEFLRDQRAALAEMVRVLRPGGVLLTTRRRGRDAHLMPGKALDKESLAGTLGALGLAQTEFRPWQYDYDLVWAYKPGGSIEGRGGVRPLLEVLRCPACGENALVEAADRLSCQACETSYPIAEDGVIEMHRR